MILITGATGLVGQHLIDQILNKKLQAVGITRRISDNIQSKIRLIEVSDYCDKNQWVKAFDQLPQVDAVIHLAGSLTYFGKKNALDKANVTASQVLFDVAKEFNVKQFIYASSVEAEEFSPSSRLGQLFGKSTLSSYGQSKLSAEKALLSGCDSSPIGLSIIRIGSVFSDNVPGFLSLFPEALLFNSRFGEQFKLLSSRAVLPIHTDDLNCIILGELECGTRNVNFVDAFYPAVTIEELFRLVATHLNLEHIPKRNGSHLKMKILTYSAMFAAMSRGSFGDFASYLLASKFPIDRNRILVPQGDFADLVTDVQRDKKILSSLDCFMKSNMVYSSVLDYRKHKSI
jgi:nucleoside-diphosphate-sugar epimerase